MILGSHGDGSASETEVPIVTWGAGLSYAKRHSIPSLINIKQADVAPLIATLIGIPIPVHSVVSINCKKAKMFFYNNINVLCFSRVFYL